MNREKLHILCENLAEVKLEIERLSSKLNYLHCQLHDITTAIQEAVDEEEIIPATPVNRVEPHQTSAIPVNDVVRELPNQTAGVAELPFAEEQNRCVQSSDVHNPQPVSQSVVQPSSPVSAGVEVANQLATMETVVHIDIQTPTIAFEPPVQSPAQPQVQSYVTLGISDVDNSQLSAKPIKVRYCSMVIYNDFEFSDTDYQKSNRSIYVIEEMSETIARFYPIAEQARRLMMKRVELLDPVCDVGYDLTPQDFIITEDKYGVMKRNQYGRWDIVKRCSLLH